MDRWLIGKPDYLVKLKPILAICVARKAIAPTFQRLRRNLSKNYWLKHYAPQPMAGGLSTSIMPPGFARLSPNAPLNTGYHIREQQQFPACPLLDRPQDKS